MSQILSLDFIAHCCASVGQSLLFIKNNDNKKKSVWYNPTNLHCRFHIQLNYLLMYSIVLQVHHEHLLDLMFMNLFRTSHHFHWQPLWNGTDAYFPYVGVNGCSRRTKIHSNEGGLAILLMHVLYSDCFLSTAQRLWKYSCSALWGSFKAFHWKICHLLSVSLCCRSAVLFGALSTQKPGIVLSLHIRWRKLLHLKAGN